MITKENNKLNNKLDDELDEQESTANLNQSILATLGDRSMSMNEIIQFLPNYSKFSIQQTVFQMFLSFQLKKCRIEDKILFSVNTDYDKKTLSDNKNNENEDDEREGSSDYRQVSKLARKFRTCRYTVEREFSSDSGLIYPLRVTKKNKTYYIMYFSNFSQQDKGIFGRILKDDDSIRIVVSDVNVKLEVAKAFENFVDDEWGENGYNEFRKNHGFYILTINQFFKKTTWKNLVINDPPLNA